MTGVPLDLQLLNLCAALLLLLSFAMLTQRRIVNLVNLLAVQGTVLFIATLLIAWRTRQPHLYLSAALTFALKVVLLPYLLHRLISRLQVYWDAEPLLNISGTMLVGVLIVVFAFGLAQPISALASTATRNAIGIAVALLQEAGRIGPSTVIVTTVHPLQVVDDAMPETEHDFSVDLIVTPDEVIECEPQRRPTGLYWNNLTAAKIAAIPVLAARAAAMRA